MKTACLALFAFATFLLGTGWLHAEGGAVRVQLSDGDNSQPLEFRVAEYALQDPQAPGGVSPSDLLKEEEAPNDGGNGEAASGDCGSLIDACCCGPRWIFTGDAVYLKRTTEERVLQFENFTNAPAGVVPEFDYEFGYQVSATYCRPCGDDIEISYLSVNNWSADSAGAGTAFDFGFDFFGVDLFDVEEFYNSYESDLDSLEINFRRCCGNVTLTYGFHYLNIDESLYIEQVYFSGFEEFISNTSNRMYGLQLGAEGDIYRRCNFSVNMGGKAGGYYSHQEVLAYWSDEDALFVASDEDFSFVGQAHLDVNWQVRDCVSIRGGYQMMYIADIADAVSQLDSIDLGVDPTEGGIATEDVVYYGFFLGVEICR